jgi:hypothetical protein
MKIRDIGRRGLRQLPVIDVIVEGLHFLTGFIYDFHPGRFGERHGEVTIVTSARHAQEGCEVVLVRKPRSEEITYGNFHGRGFLIVPVCAQEDAPQEVLSKT